MRQQTIQFDVFRYTFIGLDEKPEFQGVVSILNATGPIIHYSLTWHLGTVRSVESVQPPVIRAQMGPTGVEEITKFDEESRSFVPEEQEGLAQAILEVIFLPSLSVVGIESSTRYSESVKADRLRRLLESSSDLGMLTVTVEPIRRETDFWAEIKTLDQVNLAKFTLVPSNPDNRDLWKDEDEELQEAQAREERRVLKPKKGKGLNVDSKTIVSSIAQVMDGYGNGKVAGVRDGTAVVVDSRTKAETVSTDKANFLDGPGVGEIAAGLARASDINK